MENGGMKNGGGGGNVGVGIAVAPPAVVLLVDVVEVVVPEIKRYLDEIRMSIILF